MAPTLYWSITAVLVGVLLVVGVWALQTANRLDRLHVRYDLSWQDLDAALAPRGVVIFTTSTLAHAGEGLVVDVGGKGDGRTGREDGVESSGWWDQSRRAGVKLSPHPIPKRSHAARHGSSRDDQGPISVGTRASIGRPPRRPPTENACGVGQGFPPGALQVVLPGQLESPDGVCQDASRAALPTRALIPPRRDKHVAAVRASTR